MEHSLSPVMHNAAFAELGIDCVYVSFRVLPRWLRDAVRGLRSQGILGFNVTFPHKIEIVRHMQKLDQTAERIGAVNTVLNAEGELVGYNTDGVGAIEALKQNGVDLSDSSFTILGAGGAARAIVFALAEKATRIHVLNRTFRKAERLKREVKRKLRKDIEVAPLSKKWLTQTLSATNVLVNATSVGAGAEPRGSFMNELHLDRAMTVFDIVYGGPESTLLQKARQQGCKTIPGIEMLLYQGASAFEIWTGRGAPIETMRMALANHERQ